MNAFMEAADLQTFLLWATVINFAILLVASFAMAIGGEVAAKMQSRLFKITEKEVYFGTYLILGIYKIMILLFLAVPWIIFATIL